MTTYREHRKELLKNKKVKKVHEKLLPAYVLALEGYNVKSYNPLKAHRRK